MDSIRVESHIGDLAKAHDQKLSLKTNEHQQEIDRNQTIHESMIAQVRKEHELNVDLQKAAGARELDQLKNTHNRRLEECDKKLESHKKIHAEECTKKDLDIAQAVVAHQQSLEALSQDHVLALKQQQEAHQRALLVCKEAHEKTTAERDRALQDIANVEAPLQEALDRTSGSLKEVRCEKKANSIVYLERGDLWSEKLTVLV